MRVYREMMAVKSTWQRSAERLQQVVDDQIAEILRLRADLAKSALVEMAYRDLRDATLNQLRIERDYIHVLGAELELYRCAEATTTAGELDETPY
jgi:hypothetical protein